MTLFGYRLGIQVFTLIGLVALLAFLFGMDPENLEVGGMTLFFLSFWVTVSGILTLLLLALYVRVIGEVSTMHFIGGVMRQGALLGAFALTLLFLLYFSLFAWWSAALSLVFYLLLEFTSRKFF